MTGIAGRIEAMLDTDLPGAMGCYEGSGMLLQEALGYTEYDRPKKNERNRVAEPMRTMTGWTEAGQQRFAKYGRKRAWMRIGGANTEKYFEPVPEQMKLPFDE